jgi:hypothetical protein
MSVSRKSLGWQAEIELTGASFTSSSLCFSWGKLSIIPTAFMQVNSVVSLPLPEVDEATFLLPFTMKICFVCCAMLKILWAS